ncbi:HAD family hydrolase [Vibrio sp. TRT 17S01]|uniref:HAD family hydrolase n=1 Tax=Vibrio sp. TRT 17S01 TaxID=3418505 RepID=UPI003CF36015
MKYQAVIIDLDGTLLNDHNQISANNAEAIQQALKAGYHVTLASGRPHDLMLPFAKQLGIHAPLICCNGAYHYDTVKNVHRNVKAFNAQQLAELLTTLNLGHFDFTIYAQNGIYATHASKHFDGLKQQMVQLSVSSNMALIPSLVELQSVCGDVYKVLVSSSDKLALCELRDALRNTLQADLSTPNKLDITCLGVNKGHSASLWLESQHLNPNLTIAFGDGDNDISLFNVVGEPVAMENASPTLRGLANLIITDNNGCGIGQYLRLIIREGQHTCQHSYSY